MDIAAGKAPSRPLQVPDSAGLAGLVERVARAILTRVGAIGLVPVAVYVLLGAAPAVLGARWPELAQPLRAVYAWTCAQVPSHTLALGGEGMALCARCLGLYGGLWAGGAAGLTCAGSLARRPIGWRAVLVALLPMGLDVATQALGLREGSHAVRLLTGGVAGIAVGLWLLPPLQEAATRASNAARRA